MFSLNNLPGCFNNKADVANFTSRVHQTILNNATIIACNNNYRVFSHDVTAAILVSQNNETAAMLVSQTSPRGVQLFSHANDFFCSNKFA